MIDWLIEPLQFEFMRNAVIVAVMMIVRVLSVVVTVM